MREFIIPEDYKDEDYCSRAERRDEECGYRLPVRRGKWIIEDGHVCCSECGEISKEYNYCPFCGARMEE